MFKNLLRSKILLAGLAISSVTQMGLMSARASSCEVNRSMDRTVFATKEELNSSWGTLIMTDSQEIVTGQDGSNQRVLLGINPKTGKPISWWIASRTLLNGTPAVVPKLSSHMILCSADCIDDEVFNDYSEETIIYSDLKPALKEEFEYINQKSGHVDQNHYGISNCRSSLRGLFKSIAFLKGEKDLIRDSVIETYDLANVTPYTETDKFYLPSGNEKFQIISWDSIDISRIEKMEDLDIRKVIPNDYLIGNINDPDIIMWLRSGGKDKGSCAHSFNLSREQKVELAKTMYSFQLMPICKVSVENLLFASAASCVNNEDPCTNKGKFTIVDKTLSGYGMSMKISANGSELTDGVVYINESTPSIVHYANVPEKSFVTVCATQIDDPSKSYTMAIPVNIDGRNESGTIDISKLDTSSMEIGKTFKANVWVERKEKSGLIVSTVPSTTEFTVSESLKIEGVSDVTYTGAKQELNNIIVTYSGITLQEGTDYTLRYESNKDVGTAFVTVIGCGNYKDYIVTAKFNILQAKPEITIVGGEFEYDHSPKLLRDVTIKGISEEDKPTSKVVFTYYKDEQCKQKICSHIPSDEKCKVPAKAPEMIGVYYVRASIAASGNYTEAQSNVVKLEIKDAL